MRLRFEAVRKGHERATFSSGESALDDWFRKRALQDDRRNVARVFVGVDDDADGALVGFYSLSAFTIELDDLPADLARKLPRYAAIPAALIGRLARSDAARGQGIGELLVADALTRILGVSASVAAYAVVVEAKNERARSFYAALGFTPFPDSPRRLFLLTETARAARLSSNR